MKREFKTWVILLAFSIPIAPMLFIAVIYFVNCGINNNCARGDLAGVIHTPIPTLLPATLSAPAPSTPSTPLSTACSAPAETLLAAWDGAAAPQEGVFTYKDQTGQSCAATFADIQPLFTLSNLWYPGALACTSCHNASPNAASAGLDLSSYSGIKNGPDILGNGDWNASTLNQVLFVQQQMPPDAPAGTLTDEGPVIPAGQPSAELSTTPTPAPADEVPEPSNPGPPGSAINLTGDPTAGTALFKASCATCHGDEGKGGVPNPGSSDGTVPPLNPIDPLLKDPDPKIFAANIDLFIQNGSVPEGPGPFRNMPGWGIRNALTQQQIADLIAYLISLNQ
jgi:mono/diheme cytochrome c family protein